MSILLPPRPERDRRPGDQTECADRERQPKQALGRQGLVGEGDRLGLGRLRAIEEAIGVELFLGDRPETALDDRQVCRLVGPVGALVVVCRDRRTGMPSWRSYVNSD